LKPYSYDCSLCKNEIYAFIDTDVTNTIGKYELIWKIEGDGEDLFYHKTRIFVGDL